MINNWLFSIWLFKEENLGGIYTPFTLQKVFFTKKMVAAVDILWTYKCDICALGCQTEKFSIFGTSK